MNAGTPGASRGASASMASAGRSISATPASDMASADPPADTAGEDAVPLNGSERLSRSERSGSTCFSTTDATSKLRISFSDWRTSSRFASRIISSTWVWNSDAIRRAFLIVAASAFSATGMSLGPMAISATTAITAISDQAKSNIVRAS